jgi:hypothetical protein
MLKNCKHVIEKACEECNQRFNDNAQLGRHLQQYHKKPYCGACKKEFNRHEELNDHLKNIHSLTSITSG